MQVDGKRLYLRLLSHVLPYWQVFALGIVAMVVLACTQPALAALLKPAFDGSFVDTPVYDGERLGVGHAIEGPAVIEEKFTTIVLHPGHRTEFDARGNYAIEVDSKS